MIKLKPTPQEQLLMVEVDGKVRSEDVQAFQRQFEEKKGENEKMNLVMEIKDLTGYSWKGLINDLKFDMKHWNDFNKIAIVSNKKWLEIATKIGDYLPKVKVKHFNEEDKEHAMQWATQE